LIHYNTRGAPGLNKNLCETPKKMIKTGSFFPPLLGIRAWCIETSKRVERYMHLYSIKRGASSREVFDNQERRRGSPFQNLKLFSSLSLVALAHRIEFPSTTTSTSFPFRRRRSSSNPRLSSLFYSSSSILWWEIYNIHPLEFLALMHSSHYYWTNRKDEELKDDEYSL